MPTGTTWNCINGCTNQSRQISWVAVVGCHVARQENCRARGLQRTWRKVQTCQTFKFILYASIYTSPIPFLYQNVSMPLPNLPWCESTSSPAQPAGKPKGGRHDGRNHCTIHQPWVKYLWRNQRNLQYIIYLRYNAIQMQGLMHAGEPWIEHSICRLRVADKEPRIQLWATQQQFHNSMMCWIFDPTVIKLASVPFVNVSRCNQETDGKAQAWTACPYYLLKTLAKKSGQQKGKPWENNTNCSTALLPKMTWTHSNSNICLKFPKGRIIMLDLLVFIPYTSQLKRDWRPMLRSGRVTFFRGVRHHEVILFQWNSLIHRVATLGAISEMQTPKICLGKMPSSNWGGVPLSDYQWWRFGTPLEKEDNEEDFWRPALHVHPSSLSACDAVQQSASVVVWHGALLCILEPGWNSHW